MFLFKIQRTATPEWLYFYYFLYDRNFIFTKYSKSFQIEKLFSEKYQFLDQLKIAKSEMGINLNWKFTDLHNNCWVKQA